MKTRPKESPQKRLMRLGVMCCATCQDGRPFYWQWTGTQEGEWASTLYRIVTTGTVCGKWRALTDKVQP